MEARREEQPTAEVVGGVNGQRRLVRVGGNVHGPLPEDVEQPKDGEQGDRAEDEPARPQRLAHPVEVAVVLEDDAVGNVGHAGVLSAENVR